jgi:hypothetical protein
MKEKVSTLIGFEHNMERASGNSTRQIDLAIQLLFQGKIVKVEDHAAYGRRMVNDLLFDRILDRLYHEHGHMFNNIKYDRKKHEIELV